MFSKTMFYHRTTRQHWILFTALIVLCPAANDTLGSWEAADSASRPGESSVSSLFDEDVIAGNVHDVRKKAALLSEPERFDWLLKWVLPFETNSTIRMSGVFTQTDPAPVNQGTHKPSEMRGGVLVSPVHDLLDAAKELGRLQQVRDQIDLLPQTADESRTKAISSLRLLVCLELGDQPSAERARDDLLLASEKSRVTTVDHMWPEMLALYRSVNQHDADNLAAELLSSISVRGAQAGGATSREIWQAHLLALEQQTARRAAGIKSDSSKDLLLNGNPETIWKPAGRRVSRTRGTGFPEALWASHGRELQHISGHDMDFLMYRSPLRGNYEVEADLYLPAVIQPVVEMHGDFDDTLSFNDLQMPDLYSATGLGLFIGDRHLELIRRHGEPLIERVHATYVTPTPDGQGRSVGHELTSEALEGTFRIVRRGDVVTTLFADHDFTAFRIIAEHTWDTCRMVPGTLDIRTIAHNRGRAQVTWKKLDVAAERLMRLPGPSEQPKPVVFVINADGTNLKQPSPEFVWHGSPEWSPDGQRITFDAWTGSGNTSRIFIMNSDGSDVKDLGPGIIPTFSPDGKRIAFIWSGHGTTLMNVDGTDREVLSVDGWGCQWSPDGRWIVFGSQNRTPDGRFGANLTLIDVNTKETRLLLTGKHATDFQQIMWNMAWSPDGRRIVFYGNRSAGPGVALVSVDGSEAEFKALAADGVSANFSWNPDGRHVLMSRAGLLHEYDVETDQIAPIPGHSADPAKDGAVWDTTGQRITFIGVPKPQSVDWE